MLKNDFLTALELVSNRVVVELGLKENQTPFEMVEKYCFKPCCGRIRFERSWDWVIEPGIKSFKPCCGRIRFESLFTLISIIPFTLFQTVLW